MGHPRMRLLGTAAPQPRGRPEPPACVSIPLLLHPGDAVGVSPSSVRRSPCQHAAQRAPCQQPVCLGCRLGVPGDPAVDAGLAVPVARARWGARGDGGCGGEMEAVVEGTACLGTG